MIKVCVADNHPIVIYGLQKYFENNKQITINHQVSSFFEVIESFRKENSDILMIDLELTDFANVKMIRTIFTEFPFTRVIIYSGLMDHIYAPNAIKAGASAYIQKTESLESVAEIIVRVSKGNVIINENIQKNLTITPHQFKKQRLFRKISVREHQVLKLFCEGKTPHETAKLLNVSDKTIATYKSRLQKKLNVKNVIDLINKAIALHIV
jgi:DNA-binding NarL/FixJ family response regulator